MVVTLTTSPIATSPAGGTERRAHPAGRGEQMACEWHDDLTMTAFDTLLTLARTSFGIRRSGVGGRMSPSQMFEPDVRDAHEHRQTALKSEARAESLNGLRDGRLDRSSVEARRTLQANQSSEVHPRLISGRLGPGEALTGAGKEPAWPEGLKPHDHAGASRVDRTLARSDPSASSAADAKGHPRAAVWPASVEAPPASAASPSATRGATAGLHPVGPSTPSFAQDPAQHIARLLGAGRAGDVESVRAPSTASEAANPHTSSAQGKTRARPHTAQQGQADSSPQSTSRAAAKGDPAARSPFDQLIRSIRLSAGARHSSARMRLHPPELGCLRVDLRIVGERIEIDVRTETASARDLIHERAAQLTAALERHGIHVDRFDVTNDWPGGEQAAAEEKNHDSEVRGHDGRDDPATRRNAPSEDNGTSTTPDVEAQWEAVGETRLDIRV